MPQTASPTEARHHHSRSHLRSLSRGAAAHLGVRFPFSAPLSLEPRGYPLSCHRKTHLALPAGRQPGGPCRRIGLLLHLRALSQPVHRDITSGSRSALCLQDLLLTSRLSGNRDSSRSLGTVLETFSQTTMGVTGGKLTFGLVFAIWSASVGFSAIQDSLNVIYRVKETRSYLAARFSAIGVTIILMVMVTLMLTTMLGADLLARMVYLRIYHHFFAAMIAFTVRAVSWLFVAILLSLFFAIIYYFAPDVKTSHWHWITPGAVVGMIGWFLASIGLRIYVHFFSNYSVTYGGLGAVIILLTWFYLTGLMLLLGAEINSEIEAVAAATRLLAQGQIGLTSPSVPETSIES